jgi:PIN domain nuclease of toxin-antitoxin system
LAMLERRGRVSLDIDSSEFGRLIAPVHVFPVDLAVCRRLKTLDFRSDPADELIAATTLVHNVPLVTRDAVIRRSKVVPLA